jgi:hypothetical protein
LAAIGVVTAVTSDAEGRYEAVGLPPGQLSGSASRSGYVAEFREPGTSDDGWMFYSGRKPAGVRQLTGRPGDVVEGEDFDLLDEADNPYDQWVTIGGVVVDPQGQPTTGVTVQPYSGSGFFNSITVYRLGRGAVSDAAGRVTLREKKTRMIGVAVAPTRDRPFYGATKVDGESFTLTVKPCGAIHGIVVTPDGDPVADARLMLDWTNLEWYPLSLGGWGRQAETVTDGDGLFTRDLLGEGAHQILVQKEGMRPSGPQKKKVDVRAGQTIQDVVIFLEPDDTAQMKLKGRLVDARGRPQRSWRTGFVPTDAEGRFEAVLTSERAWLNFLNARWLQEGNNDTVVRSVEFATRRWTPADGALEGELTFALPRPGAVHGRVVDTATGGAVAGASMELGLNDSERPLPRDFTEVMVRNFTDRSPNGTNREGAFRFDDVPPGRHVLSVTVSASNPHTVDAFEVRAGETVDLGEIRVASTAAVTGRALDAASGEPLVGGVFRLEATAEPGNSPLRATLDDFGGRFRIEGIALDARVLRLKAYGVGSTGSEWIFVSGQQTASLYGDAELPELGAGETPEIGTVAFQRYGLKGRMIEADSMQPVNVRMADVQIELWDGDRAYAFYKQGIAFTENGGFNLPYIPPGIGRARLTVTGYLPTIVDHPPPADAQGNIDLGDVALDRGRTVRGTVRSPAGEPVASGGVTVGQPTGLNQHADIAPDGTFAVSGLRPGPATFTANEYSENAAGIYGLDIVVPEEGELDLNVRLLPPATP